MDGSIGRDPVGVVTAARVEAAEAGARAIAEGGTAADAAVATLLRWL